MANKVSMENIAKQVGLSKNTVSLALRGMPGISADTRALIIQTAHDMGYLYKQTGNESYATTRSLCLVVPTIAHDREGFFAHIQIGIEQEARKHHFNTIFHSYEEDGGHFELPQCVRESQVSGIISVGRVSEGTARTINRSGIPYIMADTYLDLVDEDCVHTDNILGGDHATEYLISMGHRDIGFIGDINATVSFRDRYQGFRNAMQRHGLPVNEGHCIIHAGLDVLIREDSAFAVAEVEKLDGLPTAFFCANDAGAISLYRALGQMGVRIPADVSVMGFDDTNISALVSPELSTMRVQKEWMGRKAFVRLLEKIHAKAGGVSARHPNGFEGEETVAVRERTLLSAELVERKSVRVLTKK